jgi:hypothetical protein
MKLRAPFIILIICLILGRLPLGLAQDAPASKNPARVEYDLKSTMTENIRSTQAEDVDAMMKTLHSGSPVYETTRRSVSQIFGKVQGLKYDLLSIKFLAVDGDYAVARVRQRTTKTPPENFRNNDVDMIVAFKQEDGTWKIWNQVILEVKYLSP